tara:strand:+ start:52 stop:498 length:447 start_codon:yes stop_codon:yes gene_type:complete
MKSLLLILFFLYSCQESFESKYDKALKLSENSNYRQSNAILHEIIDSEDSSQETKNLSYFLLADIYLKINQYENAISSYKSLLKTPIENKLRKQSLFMVGYIYFNNLHMYTHAKKYYEQFKTEYRDDNLIASVDYELESINKIINNGK